MLGGRVKKKASKARADRWECVSQTSLKRDTRKLLDVTITLLVALQSIPERPPIRISASEVGFDVDWSFFENLASLGCGAFVERGMSKLGQILMEEIVQEEVVPAVAEGINDLAMVAMRTVQENDPLHRAWHFVVAALSPDGLRLKICPT